MDKLLLNTLTAAFPQRAGLAQAIQLGLNLNFNEIVGEGLNLQTNVFDLLVWAESRGKTNAVIQAAVNANPTHAALIALARAHGIHPVAVAAPPKPQIYAGIGSRQTPPAALDGIQRVAIWMARQGWTLRSGGAPGADTAWEVGALTGDGQTAIYVPDYAAWQARLGGPGPDPICLTAPQRYAAEEIARTVHPAWNRCDDYARACHARNVAILFGATLDSPVSLVLYWAQPSTAGEITGGTHTAVALARRHTIPTWNLAVADQAMVVDRWLRGEGSPPC